MMKRGKSKTASLLSVLKAIILSCLFFYLVKIIWHSSHFYTSFYLSLLCIFLFCLRTSHAFPNCNCADLWANSCFIVLSTWQSGSLYRCLCASTAWQQNHQWKGHFSNWLVTHSCRRLIGTLTSKYKTFTAINV